MHSSCKDVQSLGSVFELFTHMDKYYVTCDPVRETQVYVHRKFDHNTEVKVL